MVGCQPFLRNRVGTHPVSRGTVWRQIKSKSLQVTNCPDCKLFRRRGLDSHWLILLTRYRDTACAHHLRARRQLQCSAGLSEKCKALVTHQVLILLGEE